MRFHRTPRYFDLVLDARPLSDPDAGSLRGHIGLHLQIQQKLVRDALHGRSIRWFCRRIARCFSSARKGSDVYILICCKSGRHRSVALCELLGRALRLCDLDAERVVISHFSSDRICGTQCQRSGCRHCATEYYGHWKIAEEFANLLDEEWEAGMTWNVPSFW